MKLENAYGRSVKKATKIKRSFGDWVFTVINGLLMVLLGGGSFSVGGMLGEMLLGGAVGALTGAVRANLHPRRIRAVQG